MTLYNRLRIMICQSPGGFYEGVFEECIAALGAKPSGFAVYHNCGRIPLYLLNKPSRDELVAFVDLLKRFPEAKVELVREGVADDAIHYTMDDIIREIDATI